MHKTPINVSNLRRFYFDELHNNQSLRAAPVYVLSSYSCYMTDLMWCELFAPRLGGRILRLFTTTGKSLVLNDFDESQVEGEPETYADYHVRKVKSNYRYEDHGASELRDRFVAIREIRGGDADVPTALVLYFNPSSQIKYWLWLSVAHRRLYGELGVWGNVVSHFLNPWIVTRVPEEEPMHLECKLTRDKEGQTIKRWRSPISLDLVACGEINFLEEPYYEFQRAIVAAHDAYSEDLVRSNLTPIIRGTEAETKLLFWRNEYYPPMPEMPRVYNVRRYLSALEALR